MLGFVSSALPEHNINELVSIAQTEGLGQVEVLAWPLDRGKEDLWGLTQFNPHKFSQDLAGSVSIIGYYVNWAHVKDLHFALEHFDHLCRAAGALGARVGTHVGVNNVLTAEANWDELVPVMEKIARIAGAHGVQVGFETSTFLSSHLPFGTNIGAFPFIWDRLIDLSPLFGLIIDTAQSKIFGLNSADTFYKYSDRIFGVHLRDVELRDVTRRLGSYLAAQDVSTSRIPGAGQIQWERIGLDLATIDYNGPLSLEFDAPEFNKSSLGGRVRMMRNSAQLMAKILPQGEYKHDAGNMLPTAITYLRKGWSPIPLIFRGKEPGYSNHLELEVSDENVHERFRGLHNVGVRLGRLSGNLVDVDLDCELAERMADKFLPPTGAIFGRASKKRSHWLYYIDEPIHLVLHEDPWICEVRGDKCHTVFPPSLHISGELIEWFEQGEPAHVRTSDLLQAVENLANETRDILCTTPLKLPDLSPPVDQQEPL